MSRRPRTLPRRAAAARGVPHRVVDDIDDPLTCGRCQLLRTSGIHDPVRVAAHEAKITALSAAVDRRYDPHGED